MIYSFINLRDTKTRMVLNKTTRIFSIGIVLIFGVGLIGVGAADRPGCDMSSCLRISGMTDSPITPFNPSGHPSAATGGCCSGPQDAPCDVENSTPFDNQADGVSLAIVPTGDPSGVGIVAHDIPTGNVNLDPSGSHRYITNTPRSAPIYLQNLSLLI